MSVNQNLHVVDELKMYANLKNYVSFDHLDTENFSHIDFKFEFKPSSLENYIPMIFYINLDHRTDRKELLEKELNELGLPFERFSAIKDSFGAVGCSKSHLAVLKLARERNYPRVLILEDDFTFVSNRNVFENVIGQIRDDGKPYDVCLISYNDKNSLETPEKYWKKITNAQTMSGYMVQQHYYDTLINNLEESIPLLTKTHKKYYYACDMYWKKLQPGGNWYLTSTRLGKQRASYSDIKKSKVNYKV